MASVTLAGKNYERKELDAVEEAFYNNFLFRRLVVSYTIPLAEITEAHRQHVMHDLHAIRYRAWLALRGNGLTLAAIGQLVTDENAPDVYVALWAKPPVVLQGSGPAVIAQVNAKRAAAGLPPIQTEKATTDEQTQAG